MKKLTDELYNNEYYEFAVAMHTLNFINYLIKPLEEKESKSKLKSATIAAYHGKSRSMANSVKSELIKQLKINDSCPYCCKSIGDEPHCDHIYPVSKGGLSTNQNMVFVCSDCNLKKKDMTLRDFILFQKLDRNAVETRLEKLGKKF